MLKSTYFLIIISCLTLVSCHVSISTHAFKHYGTDALRYDSDFFYVKNGLTGTSKAVYNIRGGGHVRSGLIADAKRELYSKHPLQPNQAYINMSVDVITTQNGSIVWDETVIKSTEISVVVSADIIEYGKQKIENEESSKTGTLTGNSDNSNPGVFFVGDKIIYNGYNGLIVKQSQAQNNRYQISYSTAPGETATRWVYNTDLQFR